MQNAAPSGAAFFAPKKKIFREILQKTVDKQSAR